MPKSITGMASAPLRIMKLATPLTSLIVMLGITIISSSAHAQSNESGQTQGDKSGQTQGDKSGQSQIDRSAHTQSDESAQAQSNGWKVSIGTGLSYAPRYDGDAENQLRFIPLLDINYNNGKFFIGVTRGIGFNFSEVKYFQYGVRILVGVPRSQYADARLSGMGSIDYYPEGSLFFSTRLGFISFSSNIASSDYGTHADVGGNIVLPLGDDDRFRVGATISWGDSVYNQTYFGVTAAQAAASGNVLTAYDASEGKKDTALSASWVHNFDKSWFSTTSVSYKRLEGSAQLSPLTQRTSMVGETLMLGYRF